MNHRLATADDLITLAISEDIGDGDHTTLAVIEEGTPGKAVLLCKEEGVLAGMRVAQLVFRQIDKTLDFKSLLPDGTIVYPGDQAFEVSGAIRSILTAERLVLNYLQRMSGIATHTHHLCSLVSDLPVKLLDTRKTTPNMRVFEKMAVRIGGGYNHRFGLFDMILIKNNHVDFAGGIEQALRQTQHYLKSTGRKLQVELEVRNLAELEAALRTGGFQRVMFDNFSVEEMRTAVEMVNRRYETEASGGINEHTLRDYALTGVDYISVGALTHQVKSLDMSLRAMI
jgi:nicotinate-nucleotide pyrophosphorylase (carboxylating)